MGAAGVWWSPQSSKLMRPDAVGLGGFDSHTLPPHPSGDARVISIRRRVIEPWLAGSLLVVGTYFVLFSVRDANTSADCSTTLPVRDTLAPQLSVRGANPRVVECHGSFVDPGALGVDACAGDLHVVVTGSVDTNTPG